MIKSFFKNKNSIFGIGLFIYFFMLLLGVLVPSLRIGTSGGFSIAFIYRSAIFTLFFIIVIFLYYKKYHSIYRGLALFLMLFFITNILAIFIPHGGVAISLSERFMATLYLISIIFTIFAFIEVLPSYIKKDSILIFLSLLVITMVICALYSDIKEAKDIIAAFTAKGEDAHFHQIHSFFDNKNSYGIMLYSSIVGTMYLFIFTKKKWLFIPMVYLFINLIISRSKTGIIILVLSILIILLYYFFKSFKKHPKRNVVIVSLVFFLIYFGILCVYVKPIYTSFTFLSNLSNYVREAFIGQGFRSIQDRISNIVAARELFLTPRIIIGYGEHTCYTFANGCCYSLGYIDNAYLYNLLAGGVFKTGLFIYCYYLIFKNVRTIKKNKNVSSITKIFMVTVIISILIYGLMENCQILGSNHLSIIFLLFTFIIPLLIKKSSETATKSN